MLTKSGLGDNRATFLMHDIARLVRARFDLRARALGITRPQWRVLFYLDHYPGLSQSELADALEVERITLCRMIDRLQDAGLVERRADASDRRVWRLHLLPHARPLVDQLAAIGHDAETEMLSPLSPAEHAAFLAMLGRIRDALPQRAALPLALDKEVA